MSIRVTVTLDDETYRAAQRCAKRSGAASFSAYVNRAVRRATLRDALDAERRWLGANPDGAAAAVADAQADEADRAAAAEADLARAAGRRAA